MAEEVVFPGLYAKYLLPMYPKIEPAGSIEKHVGQEYDIVIKQDDREDVVHHRAILVCKETMAFDEVPPILLALDAHTGDPEQAKEKIFQGKESLQDRVVILIFMRLEKTEEFVKGGWEKLTEGDNNDD